MLSPLLRVAGIGDGLFVIFFFVSLSVLICAIGLRTDRPSLFCVVAVLLSLFVILLMVLVPKAPPNPEDDSNKEYDHTHGFRIATVTLMGIGLLITFILVCGQLVVTPIQGSRIRST